MPQIDPNQIPPELLQQLAAEQQGGQPPPTDPMMGQPPIDPAMQGPPEAGMPPEMMGQPPMPPEMGMPPVDPSMMSPPLGNDGGTFQEEVAEDDHPEMVNLADHMEQEELDRIAEMVLEDIKQDEESREEWLNMHATWIDLYYQRNKPVNPPWPGSSQESVPILVEGCNQFSSRIYKAFFGSPNFVAAVPIGKASRQDRDRAERVGRHMSWQLDVRDPS